MRNPMKAMDQSVAASLKRTNLAAGYGGTAGFLLIWYAWWALEVSLDLQMLPWWCYLLASVFLGAAISSGIQQAGARRAALKALHNFMDQSRAAQQDRDPEGPRP